MTDTIIKGTGNSRTLKTVPNAAALYPDFDAFLAAMIAGTLPIDIGPLNPTGLQQHGTDLNKANLLTDETEKALWGSSANRTPDQALSQIKSLITGAINQSVKFATGSYMGTGNKNGKTFNVGKAVNILFVFCESYDNHGIFVRPSNEAILVIPNNIYHGNVEWPTLYSVKLSPTNTSDAMYSLDLSGFRYYYVALCT